MAPVASLPSFTNRPPRPPERGFTILDVMFAAIVLVMALVTSVTVLERGFMNLDSARNYLVAGQIMQSEIERIRVCPWTSTGTVTGIADYPSTTTTVDVDTAFTSSSSVGTRFTLTRSISDPATNLRLITVTVSWRGVDGRPQSCTMSTYYARYGLYDFFVS